MNREVLYETDGIVVIAENGIIYESTEYETFEWDDTPEYRIEAVNDAKYIVRKWKNLKKIANYA